MYTKVGEVEVVLDGVASDALLVSPFKPRPEILQLCNWGIECLILLQRVQISIQAPYVLNDRLNGSWSFGIGRFDLFCWHLI